MIKDFEKLKIKRESEYGQIEEAVYFDKNTIFVSLKNFWIKLDLKNKTIFEGDYEG